MGILPKNCNFTIFYLSLASYSGCAQQILLCLNLDVVFQLIFPQGVMIPFFCPLNVGNLFNPTMSGQRERSWSQNWHFKAGSSVQRSWKVKCQDLVPCSVFGSWDAFMDPELPQISDQHHTRALFPLLGAHHGRIDGNFG